METLELKQPANSIELARNAKGQYSWVIKCRGDDDEEVAERISTWQKALDRVYMVMKGEKDASATTE